MLTQTMLAASQEAQGAMNQLEPQQRAKAIRLVEYLLRLASPNRHAPEANPAARYFRHEDR